MTTYIQLNFDPSVIDMLIPQLDDAPVSLLTLSFQLVSIHMDLLTDKPTKDLKDERSQILKEHSIYSHGEEIYKMQKNGNPKWSTVY